MNSLDIDAVIFDMDGTLVQTESIHHRAWEPEILATGRDITPDDYLRWFTGVTNRDICDGLLGLSGDEIEATLAAVDRRFWEIAAEGISPIAGVHELLQSLQDMPRAIATNAERDPAIRTLAFSGLISHFEVIVTLSDVANGKPAPDVYLEAAARLQVEPSRCLVFEDSRPGVAAALAAGMHCIALTPTHVGYDGAHLIVGGWDDPRIGPLLPRRSNLRTRA
jgi:HAD superfamily hydrolase (TIGR01509 family)